MFKEFSDKKLGALNWLNKHQDEMFNASDTIFKWAEQGLREYKSSRYLADLLLENGFDTERGISGMPTAFKSE